ncbi:AraC family transcriptional regulator [Knoellia sinensis KCTC 19936]|uniref:AraC family transcriptional regulator n=1 Tax=Knoellia sinensis KCTC 19936 TaxID=1385520 RepID=A0A0A0JDU2_9MICO|nr:AraC family transcriptional regulator [Knoellia sinensis]KGN34222.1 AraC family transcriptional regulator [Knoellia sinensis KCTC 19936]
MHKTVLRSTRGAAVTVAVAAERGVPPEVSLRGTGITAEMLESSDAEVTREQDIALVTNVIRELGPTVGLGSQVGMGYSVRTFGVWGYALLTSPNLGSALRTGMRFLDLSFALSVPSLRVVGDEARLHYDVSQLPEEIRGFTLERDGMATRRIELDLLGYLIELRHIETQEPGTPEEEAMLSQFFQTPVTMNAAESYGAFDAALLESPLAHADPERAEVALSQCRAALAFKRSRIGYAGAVRSALISGPQRWSDIGAIAAGMHISERTLQRRLIQEGTSFRDLVAEVRESLAIELLATGMPVAEVAERLGYVEVSSFSQAFHRWRGVGPSAYRAKQPSDVWEDRALV